MPSALGHAAAALALGTALRPAEAPARLWVLGAACAMVPDLDVIALRVGVPYGHVLGHRGLSHGLIFAAVLGAAVTWIFFRESRWQRLRWRLWTYFFLATASHGVLDAMTNGGLGIAFFAPFETSRYFVPWRPIEVSPISIRRFLDGRGVAVLASEVRWVMLPAGLFVLGVMGWRRTRQRTSSGRPDLALQPTTGAASTEMDVPAAERGREVGSGWELMRNAPANTTRLSAQEAAGTVTARHLIDWAVQALCDGYDTPRLRRLAGMDLAGSPSVYDAIEAFRQTLAELGVAVPEREALLRDHVRELARGVVDGTVEPEAAVDLIHREVLDPLKHPKDLMAWCYLWEGLDPDDFASITGEVHRQAILRTARVFAQRDHPA